MFEHLEYLHLPHGGLLDDLVLLGLLKLLDGDDFFVLIAAALEYDPVGSLPDEPQNIVFLHIKFMTITPAIKHHNHVIGQNHAGLSRDEQGYQGGGDNNTSCDKVDAYIKYYWINNLQREAVEHCDR